jgi:hypothetical protein
MFPEDTTLFEVPRMKRRSFFLSLAAGLVATMAFGTPSYAGPVTEVTTTGINVGLFDYESFVVNYSFTGGVPAAFTGLSLVNVYPSGTITSTTSGSTGTVTTTFTGAEPSPVAFSEFTFTVPVAIAAAEGDVKITSAYFVTTSGDISVTIHPTFSTVPEPASMALLGIGMTGLLAFRRLLSKRNSVI